MEYASRSRTNKSGGPASVVAGVLLASAAIPFAAAGIAWPGQAPGGPSGPRGYVADSGGGTADVKGDPYLYDNERSDFICHEAPGSICGRVVNT